MPEIKHNFTGGKMNKDVDERLVPKGEYRDALNIQVSTSEGSDVGTVQNILGNSAVTTNLGVDSNSICVGAIADEKNDALYWFVREPMGIPEPRDIIFELKNGYVKKVFVDYKAESGGVLKFPENIITGINIIDDMLFWTDGITEPKKINISRSIEGTFPNGSFHTRLINPDQNISFSSAILIKEEHITVIRKAPKNVLTVKTESDPIVAFGVTSAYQTFLIDPNTPAAGNVTPGTTVTVILFFPDDSFPPSANDVLLFNPSSSSSLPNDEYQVSAILTNQTSVSILGNTYDGSTDLMWGTILLAAAGTYVVWDMKIQSIDGLVSTLPEEYNWAVQFSSDVKRFKNKFPRFSYRYKYEDGEYSAFAPFTSVVFEPENFKYDVKDAFNLGMENAITKITLSSYSVNMPSDVISVDLLYKESNSPVVYTVDTIDSVDGLTLPTHSYEVKPNQIKAALPENQLLRAWDNVPRVALAQEITGNRVIYGNYLQNYNLQETPKLLATLVNRGDCDTNYQYKSLKSIRNYSLGVSYLDEYGRQTPVFTNREADVDIPISKSDNVNQVSSRILGSTPDWAKYYKVFVKETSSEYYNLAMDRIYDARDGNVWLSFPSSDRNKVDEETFLILKKGVEGAQPVDEKNRYKILAIENEAPDFIKTELKNVGTAREDGSGNFPGVYFINNSGYPISSKKKIIIKKTEWDTIGLGLENFDKIEVKFSILVGGTLIQETKAYEVISFEGSDSPDEYTFILAKTIEEEWLANPALLSEPEPTIGITIFSKELENRPEFDGRFFVKVSRDININNYIVSQAMESMIIQQQVGSQIPFYYLSDSNGWSGTDTSSAIIGISGGSTSTKDEWEAFYANTGAAKSTWFIDEAYYSGYLPPSDHSSFNSDGFSKYGSSSSVYFYNNAATSGYNKGIWTDSNGQSWIYLSFGYIKADDNNSWVSSSTNLQSSSPSNTQIYNALCYTGWNSSNGGCNNDSYEESALTGGMYDHAGTNNRVSMWKVGDAAVNPNHGDESDKVMNFVQGQKFKFLGDPDNTVYTINAAPQVYYHLSYYNNDFLADAYTDAFAIWGTGSSGSMDDAATEHWIKEIAKFSHSRNRRVTWRIPIDANPTDANSSFNPIASGQANAHSNIGTIQFIEEVWASLDDQIVPEDPAIWETEPKQDTDLDIYYEIDGTFPLEINNDTNYTFAPIGSTVSIPQPSGAVPMLQPGTTVVGWDGNVVELSAYANNVDITQYMTVVFSRPDGSCVEAELVNLAPPIVDDQGNDTSFFLNINPNVSNQTVKHSWFNCYSFGNGVESDRVRDDYNQVRIGKGAKASSTLDEPYKEENRKYGLIYSGVYNSTSGVNNLNQFIAAEKITKDINPIYGSIQKLHSGWSQGGDLVTLCEDRVLKILANKDALYNADGNSNVTSTNNVLGQAIPYSGEYGISKNPESFASEAYRIYFTDKVRGTVMRLSMDGLTPISAHGMKDWFRDNLKLSDNLIGSYDDKKDEYNITLEGDANVISRDIPGYPITATFREDVKGWVSFKSFTPENAVSCANEYYTFKDGNIWKHHDESVDANSFYLSPNNSSFTVIINEMPGSIKSFTSINYEGSQSRVIPFTTDTTTGLTDGEYYNLTSKPGWYVDSINTDKEFGSINEFIEKEGKWFNYIKGKNIEFDGGTVSMNSDGSSTFDQASFAIQGFGILNQGPEQLSVYGCTDPTMFGYDPAANVDDGSCQMIVYGCSTEPSASNYNSTVNTDDGSCVWLGCHQDPCVVTNSWFLHPDYPTAYSYNLQSAINSLVDDGSCITTVYGCTITPGTMNYNQLANVLQVSCADTSDPCIYQVDGCILASADNTNNSANVDDGTCTWAGCTEPLATNYVGFPAEATAYVSVNNTLYGIQDDGSCLGGGCMDPLANNYDAAATYDPYAGNGSCLYCALTTAAGAYDGIPVVSTDTADETINGASNGQIAIVINPLAPYLPFTYELTDSSGNTSFTQTPGQWLGGFSNAYSTLFYNLPPDTYSVTIYGSGTGSVCSETYTGIVVGTTTAPVYYGCTDSTACNYDFAADATHVDNNSCEFTTCAGCIDPTANFPNASWGSGAGTSYQSQTGNPFADTPQCITPGSGNVGPCTIACGDGNDATSYGNYCCGYSIPGCTDPTACNYTAAPNGQTVVDGSVTCNYSGCTDSSANNYLPCATIDDGSCTYTVISGCTDPAACNYDQFATTDDGSCILGFAGVTIGDPVFAAANNLALPFYYHDNGTLFPQIGDTIQNMVIGGYPADTLNDVDVALSIQSLDPTMSQYGTGDTVKFQLREASDTIPVNYNSIVDGPVTISNTGSVVWNHQSGGAVYGERSGNYIDPYPWGPAASSSSNYIFDYKYWVGGYAMVKKYKIEVWSEINGVEYGKHDGATPSCGVYHEFFFTGYDACSSPYAISGCTDQAACNYDSTATCNDGSCYYVTTQTWVNDPITGCFECNECGAALPSCGTLNSDGTPVVILTTSCIN
jgi:hypothetical protein